MTLGFRPGDLIILAGRPAMGKTALVLNIARHVGIVEGKPVLIFSMDSSDGDLIQQMIACVGQVDARQLRCGKLDEKEWSHVSYALGMLHEAPIYISESEGLSSDQLRSVTNRFCRRYGGVPSLIVVDFIQLMSTRQARAGQAENMFKICHSLKALAKELGVPIIALSQLPGTVEQRIDKRPMLADLMDCGPVEQVADLILMLYRDEYYRADSLDHGSVELIIGKQRNGPTGTVRLAYNPEQVRFNDINP
jgi:replicative DNA helicase